MMKKFLRFCYNQIPVRERAATLVAALFENGCILLAAYAAAMLIDGMAGGSMMAGAGWHHLLVLAAALAVQAVCGTLGRYLLSGISERVRLSYRRRLHRPSFAGLAAYCCEHVDALDEFFQKVVPLVLTGLIRMPLFWQCSFIWMGAAA